MVNKLLWEILVPTVRNDGRPIHTRFHKVWDEMVREISGGLTIMPVAKGQWVYKEKLPEGVTNETLFVERMIPVRIIATREEIETIISMTMEYYEQLAVLAYKVSDEVILRHRNHQGDLG